MASINSTGKTRVGVVGVGAFGRNHVRVYHQLHAAGEPVELVGIVDSNAASAEGVAREFSTRAFASVHDLSGRVDAVSIAAPTVHHLPIAQELMNDGVDILIEKPLASSLAEADELESIARSNGRIVQVGHLERFNPAVRATIPLLNQPMFFEVHRLSVFTPRSLDVDVILDLMIHDLDVVLSFVKSQVKNLHAVGLPIISPKVDIANVRVEFESGCVANSTASRVSTERVRKLRFFQPHQYISIDYARQDVISISVDERAAQALMRGEVLPGDAGRAPGVKVEKPAVTPGEPLMAELKAFLDSVRHRTKPVVTLTEGRSALELALEINAAIAQHHRRAGIPALTART